MATSTLSHPLVSVIIPSYNRVISVQSAIHSVLRQSFTDFELIVIDDGSTDGTSSLLSAQFGDDIQLITTSNSGVSSSRNKGIRQCKGQFIALLDSDDIWHEEKLERQLEFHLNNPQFQISQTQEIWVRKGKRVNPMNKHRKPENDIFLKSLDLCTVSPSSVFMKKSLFTEFKGFDENLPTCEDYDLWLRISSQYPVGLIDEPLLTKFGGHSDQLSAQYAAMDRFRVYSLVKLILNTKLSPEQHNKAREVCIAKMEILIQGMRKRGTLTDAFNDFFQRIIERRLTTEQFELAAKDLLITNKVFIGVLH